MLVKLNTFSRLEIRNEDDFTIAEIDNSYFTRVEDFKYLVTNLTYQYYIKE